jgi:hypothetical protein
MFVVGGAFGGTYSGGTGEQNDPYRIATAADMNAIGANPADWGSHFLLVNDVNLAVYTGTQFKIIGTQSNPFTGVFDGNGYTIANFSYSSTGVNYVGLFGRVDGANAVIKDLTLANVNVNAGNSSYPIGALVGYLSDGTVTNCYAKEVNVSGYGSVGGLIGCSTETIGTISNCRVTGSVVGDHAIGGLIGYSAGNSAKPIINCSVDCTVTGDAYVGGLVGQTGSGQNLMGGLISKCFVKGSVKGNVSRIGGLVGANGWQGIISNCYATNSVDGNSIVGGLVGSNFGSGSAKISNCYSSGCVTGNTSTGGLVGDANSTDVTGSFWDTSTSGQSASAGGTGKTTAEMQMESTFRDAGWDFVDVWDIGENQTYPFLRKYAAGDSNHDGIVNFLDVAILADDWLKGQ